MFLSSPCYVTEIFNTKTDMNTSAEKNTYWEKQKNLFQSNGSNNESS